MGNRRYTLEQKITFIDTYEKFGSVKGAARAVGLENDGPCDYWLRHKKYDQGRSCPIHETD